VTGGTVLKIPKLLRIYKCIIVALMPGHTVSTMAVGPSSEYLKDILQQTV
jgi:hypothetical protein